MSDNCPFLPWVQVDKALHLYRLSNYNIRLERGQGLNSAFKDASELVRQITAFLGVDKTLSRQAGIDAYEKEMIERTGNEVRLSAQSTRMVHIWEEALRSPLVSTGFAKAE